MKKEIVIRRSIYSGKEHKLIWSGTGRLYYFQPAEDWMLIYINYDSDTKVILSIDSDGFGHPLCVGDKVDDMTVEAIIDVDEKIGIMLK